MTGMLGVEMSVPRVPAIATASLLLALAVGGVAHARAPAWGDVLDSYDGESVHYNGSDSESVHGDSRYGPEWQCVELVQRYFAIKWGLPRHWRYVDAAWQMYGHPPPGVDRYPNRGPI